MGKNFSIFSIFSSLRIYQVYMNLANSRHDRVINRLSMKIRKKCGIKFFCKMLRMKSEGSSSTRVSKQHVRS